MAKAGAAGTATGGVMAGCDGAAGGGVVLVAGEALGDGVTAGPLVAGVVAGVVCPLVFGLLLVAKSRAVAGP